MRRLLCWRVALTALGLLLAAGLIGGWLLLRSEAAARIVARKLEEQFGTPVQFDRLSVGVTGSSVSGLRVYERGADPTGDPFLAVGTADVDVSAIGVARGPGPSLVPVQDAHVLLRFDWKGDLRARLPSARADRGPAPHVPDQPASPHPPHASP